MKPLIGILAHINFDCAGPHGQNLLQNTYVISTIQAGGTPIIIPSVLPEEDMDTLIAQIDGFIFSGGMDISPKCYNEDGHAKLGATNYSLDTMQITFAKKVLAAKKPILGICRGHQLLNVAAGGSLYQDVSEYNPDCLMHFQKTTPWDTTHTVHIEPGSKIFEMFGDTLETNSFHHQSVKAVGPNVKITATAADGIIESIELKDQPFAIGIQWHPEMMFANGKECMRPVFEALINASR